MSTYTHLQDLKRRHQTVSSWKVGWRLTKFLKPYWKTVLAMWAVQAVNLAMLFVPADVIGRVANDVRAGDCSRLWIYAVVVVANELLRFGISFGRAVLDVRATGRAEWDMQVKLYDVLQRKSISYHERESSGQLISRMIMDMRFAGGFFRVAAFAMAETALVFLIGLGYLFYKNWVLALWSLVMLPAAAYFVLRYASTMRIKFYDVREKYGDLTTVLSENIAGVQVVRGFAREQDQIDKFARESRSLIGKVVAAERVWTFYAPLYTAFVTLGLAVTFFIGGQLILGRPMDKALLGVVVSFFLALRQITSRLNWLGQGVSNAQRAIASADRIFETLDERPDVDDQAGARPLAEGPGRVVFENVSFGYDKDTPVLKDINLVVEPGQMVALVGRTGSGKSTLVSLLPRFYDVTSGRLLIDGQDVRDMTLDSLRADIGLVFQDSFLFSRSVAENIAYADPDADMDQVMRTAETAQAHDFVKALPKGYETIIGERGVTLSGGQRQRLTIARALMKDPRVLILDDSTSSVDSTTEREIHDAMMHLAKYRTTFVIAHRLSTVRHADVIIVLENGRVVERGTHDELMRQNGIYRTICTLQFDTGGEPVIVDDTQVVDAKDKAAAPGNPDGATP
jgi:ATP-binding cassette subfamily B protein